MMPHAGGQYVYLRESLGPIWGFLYGWTLFLVIQTGTIAAVGVAFGKFLGVFFPSISASSWLVHIYHVPVVHLGPMGLGGMDIGLNTQNLTAIVLITLLTILNSFGVKLGTAIQNVFTSAKVLALLAVIGVGFVAKNAAAIAANFGAGWHNFWAGSSLSGAHVVQVGISGPQRHGRRAHRDRRRAGRVSLFSSDSWNNVTFTAGEVQNPKRNLPLSLALGTGVVLLLYILCNFVYLSVLPLVGRSQRDHRRRPRHPVRRAGSRRHRGHGRGLRRHRREVHGRRHPHLHLRLRQRHSALRRARVLRDEPRRALLQVRRPA